MPDDQPAPTASLIGPMPEPEAQDGAARLRAFEDKVLPPPSVDHPRPGGAIERGVGSPFAGLDAVHKAHHAALEDLIIAEAAAAKADTAAADAQDALYAATKRAAATEEALAPKPAEPTEEPAPLKPLPPLATGPIAAPATIGEPANG